MQKKGGVSRLYIEQRILFQLALRQQEGISFSTAFTFVFLDAKETWDACFHGHSGVPFLEQFTIGQLAVPFNGQSTFALLVECDAKAAV